MEIWLIKRFQELKGCYPNFKMKIYLTSLANKDFYKKQKAIIKTALKFGVDETFIYTDEM